MLRHFSGLSEDTDDEQRDILWFTARIAEKTERYTECCEMVKALAAVDPHAIEHRDLVICSMKKQLESNLSTLSKLKQSITDKKFQSSNVQAKVKQFITTIQQEQEHLHADFLKILIDIFLKATEDPKDQYQLNKEIGDSFLYVADILKDDARSSTIQTCHNCYEAAVRLADSFYGKSSFQYLSVVLNYCAFEYKHMNLRDHPKTIISGVYFQAMKNTSSMSADALSILQLIRSNVASWTHVKEEEDTPEKKKKTKRGARKRK